MSGDERSGHSQDLDGHGASFSSKDEELEHWKRTAGDLRRDLEKAHEDHAEYMEQSRELEEELEKSAEASKRLHEAQAEELKSWKEKYHNDKLQSNAGMTELQAAVDRLEKERNELRIKNRDLEQENDDLQRHKREISTSLLDVEEKLSAAIERNAILQLELESSAGLKEEIQRLRDELRDQFDELAVLRDREQQQQPNGSGPTKVEATSPPNGAGPGGDEAPMLPAARRRSSAGNVWGGGPFLASQSAEAAVSTPALRPSSSPLSSKAGGAPLAFPATSKSTAAVTPTTGFGALNTPVRDVDIVAGSPHSVNPVRIISDVLSRVKDIEARLAAYRNSFASPGASPGVRRSSNSVVDAPHAPTLPPTASPGFGTEDGGDENQRSGRGAGSYSAEEQ